MRTLLASACMVTLIALPVASSALTRDPVPWDVDVAHTAISFQVRHFFTPVNGAFHDYDRWHAFLTAAGFEAIRHYYRPPGLPREEQPWLASLWRRPATQASASEQGA